MRIKVFLLIGTAVLMLMTACRDTETYAEQKEKERDAILAYLEDNDITVISVDEFLKDTVTNNPVAGPDSTLNEYVLFPESGVYMQIIRRGQGSTLQSGESKTYNVRYVEYDILHDDTLSLNIYQASPDVMVCSRTSDYFTASFVSGIMYTYYNSSSVPKGWILPMTYLKPGFYNGEQASKVRMIVPHTYGTSSAIQSVYPCFYELTITHQKWQ